MFNYMLDRYPDDYHGYLIRTDYRIGVQMVMAMSDPDLSSDEKLATALYLLFGTGAPPLEIALNGLTWFLNCTREPQKGKGDKPLSDYDYDSNLIYSAFKKQYNIDLSREKMHWFEFNALMSDLGECAFTSVVKIRSTKITSDMNTKEKAYYSEAKERCALPEKLSKQEQEARDKFFSLLEGDNSG